MLSMLTVSPPFAFFQFQIEPPPKRRKSEEKRAIHYCAGTSTFQIANKHLKPFELLRKKSTSRYSPAFSGIFELYSAITHRVMLFQFPHTNEMSVSLANKTPPLPPRRLSCCLSTLADSLTKLVMVPYSCLSHFSLPDFNPASTCAIWKQIKSMPLQQCNGFYLPPPPSSVNPPKYDDDE